MPVGHLSRVLGLQNEDMMPWDGGTFPVAFYEGQRVPEAYEHSVDLLPHLHADLEQRFPRAVAAAAAAETVVPEEAALEARGVSIGKRV